MSMKTLIDKQAVLNCLCDYVDAQGNRHEASETYEYQKIDSLPSIKLADIRIEEEDRNE